MTEPIPVHWPILDVPDHWPTLIGNYLNAEPGPEKDDAATLLALAPENQPGPDALSEVPFRPGPKDER